MIRQTVFILTSVLFLLTGCDQGPAEKAGEKLDAQVSEARREVTQLQEQIKENQKEIENAREELQKLREEMIVAKKELEEARSHREQALQQLQPLQEGQDSSPKKEPDSEQPK